MQGTHCYQPELFSQIDYGQLIPPNHLLRKIDSVLDLNFLRELTKPLYSEEVGRPSVAPDIFIRMVLLQALYNIDSDRQLCEEVGYNLAYRWFCKLSLQDRVPNHSSMTRIRDRMGEETFKKIFLTVVEQCRTAGLLKGERLMTDGSYIKANASLYKMIEREGVNIDANEAGVIVASQDGLSNKDLRQNSIVGKKLSNATHVSKTDPDATLSGKSGEYKALNYKAHHMIDADSRVIVDCHITTGADSETKTVLERVEAVKNNLNITPQEVIADRGYGSGENLKELKDRDIKTNIPLWNNRIGQSFWKEIEGFNYDEEKNQMICPQGHLMNTIKTSDPDSSTFTLKKPVCKTCPLRDKCFSENQKKQDRGKVVKISRYQSIYDEVKNQSSTNEFVGKMRERMWKMEGIFAEAKSHHGMRKARYRGRGKLQAQVYIISTVQNLKRLAMTFVLLIKSIIENLKSDRKVEGKMWLNCSKC